MGLWIIFKGELEFNKPVTPEFKKKVNDYIKYESYDDPNQPYGTMCPWWINDNNRLVVHPVKFCDHICWLEHLAQYYFEPEGYSVKGIMYEMFPETEPDVWHKRNVETSVVRKHYAVFEEVD